jgi:hypothetical protein
MNYFCYRIMQTPPPMNKSNKFLMIFIGMIIFQIFLSLEEMVGHFTRWITLLTEKMHAKISFIPVMNISAQTYMFINLIIIIVLFGFLSLVFVESKWSRILAIILGVLEILNGGLHIATSVYFVRYVPGSISAIGLIIFAVMVIFTRPSSSKTEIPEEML